MENNMNSHLGNPGEDPGDAHLTQIREPLIDVADIGKSPETVEVDFVQHIMAQDIKAIRQYSNAGWRCVGVVLLMGQTSLLDPKPVPTQFMVFVGRKTIPKSEFDSAKAAVDAEIKNG